MMLWSCSWDENYTRCNATFAGVGLGHFLEGRLTMTDSCEKSRWTSLCFVFESSGKKRWWCEDKTQSCGKALECEKTLVLIFPFEEEDNNTASIFFFFSSSWDNFRVGRWSLENLSSINIRLLLMFVRRGEDSRQFLGGEEKSRLDLDSTRASLQWRSRWRYTKTIKVRLFSLFFSPFSL